jgi:hypothetical protein
LPRAYSFIFSPYWYPEPFLLAIEKLRELKFISLVLLNKNMNTISIFSLLSGFIGLLLAFLLPLSLSYLIVILILVILVVVYVQRLPKMSYAWYERGRPKPEKLRTKADKIIYFFFFFCIGFVVGISFKISLIRIR